MNFNHLTKTGKIGNLVLKNRMVQPAMETYTANPDGSVSVSTINHYLRRAEGGVGLIILEMTNPTPGCMCFPGELEIGEDRFMPGLSKVAAAIHDGGAKGAIQLCHGGVFARNSTSDLPAFTPSGIGTFSLPGEELKVMTKEDIAQVVDDFGRAALRAKIVGFDAVEIHGGHGYLLVEFLSAYYNRRTDEYGGSVYNRTRFSIEIIQKIKEYCGKDFPIIYKLSSEDFTPNGITIDQSIEISKYLEEAGADAIMVTGGTLDSRIPDFFDVMNEKKAANDEEMGITRGISAATWIPTTYSPRYLYTENAKKIKENVTIPVITVCGLTPDKAEEMIGNGEADFAAFGRQSLADPDYANKIMESRPEDIRQCLRCNECLGAANKNRILNCAVNPYLGKDFLESATVRPAVKPKKIAIVGSGPAGLNAAITAKERNHEVVLFEKDDRLGGLMYYVGKPDFKKDYANYTNYLIHTVKKLGVDIRMNTPFTEEIAGSENFDKIIVATGSEWFIPNVDGFEKDGILNPLDVLDDIHPDVDSFVICGAGLVGCEVALHLADKGKDVTMVDIVPNSNPANLYGVDWSINAKLAVSKVKVELDKKILKMTPTEVVCATKKIKAQHDPNTGKGTERPYDFSGPYDGGQVSYQADAVICALGMRSVNPLSEKLIAAGHQVEVIGDAYRTRKILTAVHEGFSAGRRA